MQNQIEVKEIKLYDADLYYNYAIVTLTNGEKFAVNGELDSHGKFIVKKKRGSIIPYEIQLGTLQEHEKSYNCYLKNKLIEIDTVGDFQFYSLIEKYESAIADAIIEHRKGLNFDTVIIFNDYSMGYSFSVFNNDQETINEVKKRIQSFGHTSIRDHGFDGIVGLTQITIPNHVTSIGEMAFLRCFNLQEIRMSESLFNTIGRNPAILGLNFNVRILDLDGRELVSLGTKVPPQASRPKEPR